MVNAKKFMRFSHLIALFSKVINVLSESKYIGNIPGACLLNRSQVQAMDLKSNKSGFWLHIIETCRRLRWLCRKHSNNVARRDKIHRGMFSTSGGYHDACGAILWVHRGMYCGSYFTYKIWLGFFLSLVESCNDCLYIAARPWDYSQFQSGSLNRSVQICSRAHSKRFIIYIKISLVAA